MQLDHLPDSTCFSALLMGTGARGFLPDPGRPFGFGNTPLPPTLPAGRGLIVRSFRDVMWARAESQHEAEGRQGHDTGETCVLRVIMHRHPHHRRFINIEGVAASLRDKYVSGFEGCKVLVDVIEWGTKDLVRPADQLARLKATDVYISPAGSASFLGMFLPNGAGLITLPQCAVPG